MVMQRLTLGWTDDIIEKMNHPHHEILLGSSIEQVKSKEGGRKYDATSCGSSALRRVELKRLISRRSTG